MKKTLAFFAAGMIPAMLFAVPFTLVPNAPWKKTADDAASIDYKGNKIWKAVGIKPTEPLKAKTLYRITFEAKSTASPTPVICVFKSVIHGKKLELVSNFYPTTEFRKYTVYFYSGETPGKNNPYIYFNPSEPFQLEIKNIRLNEMTDDLLYGKNLLAWGDFEEDNTFYPSDIKDIDRIKVVDSANFMSGEKSLLLDCPGGKTVTVISRLIPAIPGKEIEVKFYAKSDELAKIQVTLNWWMRGSKHLYRTFQFKTEKDWKEYSLKYKVPEDVENYPSLLRCLMTTLSISGQPLAKDGNAKIYFDDIRCMIKK